MGTANSTFTEDELDDYQKLTYLTKKEILQVFKRFKALSPSLVENDKNANLSFDKITELPELKVNPFRKQICKVFSSSGNGMTFEDFLDMMSVFSDNAPKEVKAEYAFRIYDFDGDNMISKNDLQETIQLLIGNNRLTEDEMDQLIENIMKEADLDNDKTLSYGEFAHVISKAPDFVNSFRIRM